MSSRDQTQLPLLARACTNGAVSLAPPFCCFLLHTYSLLRLQCRVSLVWFGFCFFLLIRLILLLSLFHEGQMLIARRTFCSQDSCHLQDSKGDCLVPAPLPCPGLSIFVDKQMDYLERLLVLTNIESSQNLNAYHLTNR